MQNLAPACCAAPELTACTFRCATDRVPRWHLPHFRSLFVQRYIVSHPLSPLAKATRTLYAKAR